GAAFDELLALLAAETNVKRIERVESDADLVRLSGKANFRTLGKKYGSEAKQVAAAVAALTTEPVRRRGAGETIGAGWRLGPEDVVVSREVISDWPVASDGPFVVAMDPELTPELRAEGIARELVSRVQRLRKDAGYDVSTRIELSIKGDAVLQQAADEWQDWIAGETLARKLLVGEELTAHDRTESVTIDGHVAALEVRRPEERRDPPGPDEAD